MDPGLRNALAAFGALLTAILAPIATVLTTLVGLMILDFGTALVANGLRGKIDPQMGYLGWRRKASTLMVLMALTLLQHWSVAQEIVDLPLAQLVGGALCVVEFLSILRNAMRSGVRLAILDVLFAEARRQVQGNGDEPEPPPNRRAPA